MKTKEEIEATITILEDQMNSLPSHNFFGESNLEEINLMTEWIRELKNHINGKSISNEDVVRYLNGEWSEISDCL